MRFILLLAAAFVAVPAGAIDLTGTWEGTFNCSEFDGVKHKFSQKGEVLLITQVGTVLNIEWDGVGPIEGIAIDDVNKPDEKGAATIVDCDTTTDLTTGYCGTRQPDSEDEPAQGQRLPQGDLGLHSGR